MIQDNRPACWPAQFHPQPLPLLYCPDPTLAEQPLFEQARRGEAVAQLWQAPQGLVVPGSYRQFSELRPSARFFPPRLAGVASPLRRRSGPAGPGIINLSLAWPVSSRWAKPQNLSITALRAAAHAGDVWRRQPPPGGDGSFCDGRYNLACGEGEHARKIVGTAQYWRPLAEDRGHVVLAHAVILWTPI
jgi:hypothetical protein